MQHIQCLSNSERTSIFHPILRCKGEPISRSTIKRACLLRHRAKSSRMSRKKNRSKSLTSTSCSQPLQTSKTSSKSPFALTKSPRFASSTLPSKRAPYSRTCILSSSKAQQPWELAQKLHRLSQRAAQGRASRISKKTCSCRISSTPTMSTTSSTCSSRPHSLTHLATLPTSGNSKVR